MPFRSSPTCPSQDCHPAILQPFLGKSIEWQVSFIGTTTVHARLMATDGQGNESDWINVTAVATEPDTHLTFSGDADDNGIVNFADFLKLADNFGRTDAVREDGDFNGDGVVNFSDFLILAENFGESRQPVAAPTLSSTSQAAETLPTANISAADDLFERFDDELSLDNLR